MNRTAFDLSQSANQLTIWQKKKSDTQIHMPCPLITRRIFMMSKDSGDVRLKIGDFDLASLSTSVNHMKQCGTPGYMAPEVFYRQFGGYTPKTDVFSSGIILFAL